jgi:NADH-quinone oxidoreductase subunit G
LRQSVRQQPLQKATNSKIPLWLDHAVRELLQDETGPFFIAAPFATKLDNIATEVLHAAPDDLARLGFAVAHLIDSDAPAVADLSGELNALAERIAAALRSAKSPLVVSGVGCRSVPVIDAAAQIAWALCKTEQPGKLTYCFSECNTAGLALMKPRSLPEAFRAIHDREADGVIVLENDLYRRAEPDEVNAFLDGARHIIALDHLRNATTDKAEVVFPAGTFAETDGTLVNYEGRAQRFFQAFVPSGEARASWRWLNGDVRGDRTSPQDRWQTLDEIVLAIGNEIPALARIEHAAPAKKDLGKLAREPHRYSGRTSVLANISVHEPKPPEDADSALAFSMESGPQSPPSPLIPFFWSPGWNSIQSVNKFQAEVGGHLDGGDPGVRLLEPSIQNTWRYSFNVPSVFRPTIANWQLLPCFHIFGSDELSRHASGIVQLVPEPYVAVNSVDGALLGLRSGEAASVTVGNSVHEITVSLRDDVPRGVALIPVGIPTLENMSSYARVNIAPSPVEDHRTRTPATAAFGAAR